MVTCTVAKDGAVEFWRNEILIYDLSKADIGRMGLEYWVEKLKEKQWITPALLARFDEFCDSLGGDHGAGAIK